MRKTALKMAVMLAALPLSAAGAQRAEGATGFASAAPSAGTAARDDRVRAAFSGVAQSGAGIVEAASRKQREAQRREAFVFSNSAEGALLTGAGMLSSVAHLAPICAAEDGTPSFDCQILKRRQKGR